MKTSSLKLLFAWALAAFAFVPAQAAVVYEQSADSSTSSFVIPGLKDSNGNPASIAISSWSFYGIYDNETGGSAAYTITDSSSNVYYVSWTSSGPWQISQTSDLSFDWGEYGPEFSDYFAPWSFAVYFL
jgi:hypothetical protein